MFCFSQLRRLTGSNLLMFFLTYLLIFFLTYLLKYLLTFILTYLLTFFLTYLLTYLLTFFLTYLLTFFLTYLLTYFLTFLLTFFLLYQNQNLTSTTSQKNRSANSIFTSYHAIKIISMTSLCLSNVIALSASDRPAKRQLSPKMQNTCSSTHTHTSHASDRPAKRQLSPKIQKGLRCHNYILWRVQTMKPDACHCGSCTSAV